MNPTYLLFLEPSPISPLVRNIPQGRQGALRVVLPVELGAPYLNDLREPLQEDAFYPLVELSDPMLEVGVAFQVESVNLQQC